MQNFDYQFNVGGNFTATMEGMAESTGRFNAAVEGTHSWLGKLGQTLAVWDLASNYVSKFNDTLGGLSSSGISLDSQMHDLSAVAGVVGDGLKQIEGYARSSAKAFGIDASQAVDGYKLLLSQLSPELGKYPEALQAMGNCIATTSKLMGGDGVAAAEVLTTAMNQYGISLDDPMKASAEMARMMNVMAAAGQAGSAELPAIKVALQQCGMAAKAANVSFEETNAAIQVLDKSGKKGSEGGVALRNVLSTLAAGRFLPEKTQEELQKAGINVSSLTDKTKPLKERLETLKPLLKDDALLSALFGRENANAALALINGTESLQDFTEAVTGTASAEEQAAIIMDSYAERQARINQQFEDFKITVFQATGDLGIWLSTLMGALVPLSQLMPLLIGMGNLMAWIKGLQWAAMWSRVQGFIYAARLQMAFMNRELITGQFASNGFFVNITRATLAVLRFATVGIFQALKGLGALVLSFVTGGTASATFAGVASASFGAFKLAAVTACRAVSVAIMNIPIIGWIAAAIAALVALGVYFWNTSAKFRATLKGLGASFVAVFKGIWDLAKNVFGSIGDLIKAAFSLDGQGIKDAINRLKGGFSEFGTNVGKAFNDAYNAEMAASKKAEEAKKKGKPDPNAAGGEVPTVDVPTVTSPDPTGGSLGTVGGGKSEGSGKIRNITVNVDKLVERFEIHTTNLSEDLGKVKDMVGEALLSALNDVNLAM
ncbi:phage tail tape measure protein [uncultured Bacteroides sp.]|uniref:phage tail tape measure protein n=1 Tax=uncultured Bacteroides sp. TaxID=162156 RepID=UPI0008222793|nr:phage tail tape measure protein [uncultured Bacteroides sp.]SCK02589.1 Phage-related minor tail protein [uncultured Bacteroides sp.]